MAVLWPASTVNLVALPGLTACLHVGLLLELVINALLPALAAIHVTVAAGGRFEFRDHCSGRSVPSHSDSSQAEGLVSL